MSTATHDNVGAAGKGFPDELFTIRDDPGALRSSLQTYHAMTTQPQETATTLASTTASSWVGSEGELFRRRRAGYEPMMHDAGTAFRQFVSTVDHFAQSLLHLKQSMHTLRDRAEIVWSQLQAARAALASAAANLSTATVAAAVGDPISLAALPRAENAVGEAHLRVARLESEWEECVAAARRLHRELGAQATTTSAGIQNILQPGRIPDPSTGRPLPLMFDQDCVATPHQENRNDDTSEGDDDNHPVLDAVQTGLDIVGLLPLAGAPADLINAAIYEGRGDHVNAALSAAGAIPIAGWAATGTKIGLKCFKFAKNAINNPVGRSAVSRATLAWWRLNEIPAVSDATYYTLKTLTNVPPPVRSAAAKVKVTLPTLPTRLPQDIRARPGAPQLKPTSRAVGRSSHNAALRAMIIDLQKRGARDIRVNQEQVNSAGRRVGRNRPDLQYTLGEGKRARRYYVEFEGLDNPRGLEHRIRTKANDPRGVTILRLVK